MKTDAPVQHDALAERKRNPSVDAARTGDATLTGARTATDLMTVGG